MSKMILLSIISDVLKMEEPDLNKTFLELGGSSLAALKISARYEQKTGSKLSPTLLLKSPSLASAIEAIPAITTSSREELKRSDPNRRVKASMGQQWMLESRSLASNARPFQFQCAYEIKGDLQVDALIAALHDIHQHHVALRTRFQEEKGQYIIDTTEESPAIEIARCETGSDQKQRLQKFVSQSFVASDNQRWRSLILIHPGEAWTLCLAFDHLTADGWSFEVILEDLGKAYAARLEGHPPELPAAGSWLDYVELERQDFEENLARSLQYWATQLPDNYEDFSISLPGRNKSPYLSSPVSYRVALNKIEASALQCIKHTPFVIATTAMARAVSDTTMNSKVRIFTSSANRQHPGHDRTVGWFATGIFPTYLLSEDGSWPTDLAIVTEKVAEAQKVGNVPAVYVRRGIWPESPRGYREDTGIYLACSDSETASLHLLSTEVRKIDVPDRADTPGIHFFLEKDSGSWILTVHYHNGEYETEIVDNLVRKFRNQLQTFQRSAGSIFEKSIRG